MAYDFVPLRVIVKGEEDKRDFLLPDGNYITINGEDSPLSHLGTLKMPLGYCDIMVHTPPPNEKYHVETTAEENQLYYITLELDSSRNIINASFGVETITEDPFGLYENDFKRVETYLPTVKEWRKTIVITPEPVPEPYTAPTRKGGKLIGWGLAILVFFAIGIYACYKGDITMGNLTVYYIGAAIGLLMFIGGLIRRIIS